MGERFHAFEVRGSFHGDLADPFGLSGNVFSRKRRRNFPLSPPKGGFRGNIIPIPIPIPII